MNEIPTISTGQPSTLKTYRQIAFIMSGMRDDSPAVQFIDSKIAEEGEDAVVIQHETQVLMMFMEMNKGWQKDVLSN